MTADEWKLPSAETVLQSIDGWRRLSLRGLSDTAVMAKLKAFRDEIDHMIMCRRKWQGRTFWRVRKSDRVLSEVDDFWEPPAEFVMLGRCNFKGQPLLYVADSMLTACEECKIQKGDQIYLIKYRQLEPTNLQNVLPDLPLLNEAGPVGRGLVDEEGLLGWRVLREFILSEFLKPVGVGTEFLYKISAGMCWSWFDDDECDGWVYPSVQRHGSSNVALKPDVSRECLEIEEVHIVTVVEPHDARVAGRISEVKRLWFESMALVIATDYRGDITTDGVNWRPSDDIGGDWA